jgi:hypothetical protein
MAYMFKSLENSNQHTCVFKLAIMDTFIGNLTQRIWFFLCQFFLFFYL